MWIFVSSLAVITIVIRIILSIASSKEHKKVIAEVEKPLSEIIMRNYIINETEIIKLKTAYTLLFKQSSDDFQNVILYLRIKKKSLEKTRTKSDLITFVTPPLTLL